LMRKENTKLRGGQVRGLHFGHRLGLLHSG
jgi:hypothetical protein